MSEVLFACAALTRVRRQ